MERDLAALRPGMLVSTISYRPSIDVVDDGKDPVRRVAWTTPAGEQVWSADPASGRILQIGGMWLCGTSQSGVYTSVGYSAFALVAYAMALGLWALLRHVSG